MNNAIRTATVLRILLLWVGTNSLAQVQTYCTNVAGNIACTSYGGDGSSSQSYCTSIAGNLSCTTYNDDNYSHVQVLHNYEAGQVIGSALGNVIAAAIEKHRAKRQARQDWDQQVQDALGAIELACETDTVQEIDPSRNQPKMGGEKAERVLHCRTYFFALNSFLHKHRKDFVPSVRNFGLLSEAAENRRPEDLPEDINKAWREAKDGLPVTTEQYFEAVFQKIDKKQLDR